MLGKRLDVVKRIEWRTECRENRPNARSNAWKTDLMLRKQIECPENGRNARPNAGKTYRIRDRMVGKQRECYENGPNAWKTERSWENKLNARKTERLLDRMPETERMSYRMLGSQSEC